jgi:hypothetical protein
MSASIHSISHRAVCRSADPVATTGGDSDAATAAIAMFTLVAYPVLSTYNEAGSLWHVMLLGLTTPFDANLNLVVLPLPATSAAYHDLYMETVVRSYWGRLHPDSGFFSWGGRHTHPCRDTTRRWRVCSRGTFYPHGRLCSKRGQLPFLPGMAMCPGVSRSHAGRCI